MEQELLRISGLAEESVVDGPGYRFTIFTQGCPHVCSGCHNPQTHALDGGYLVPLQELFDRITANPLLKGVTFSGGEPFLQAGLLAVLAKRVHRAGLDVITYTGYRYEQLKEPGSNRPDWITLLEVTDYLIDGPYVEEQMSLEIPFRGSANQRIIDVAASLRSGETVQMERF